MAASAAGSSRSRWTGWPERAWSNELATAAGHDDADLGALVAEPANQLCTLVCGDAAADAQDDAFTI